MYKLRKNHDIMEFEVLEIETDQVVFSSCNYDVASKKYRFLNSGGAFNGFTPSFLLKKVSLDTNK